VSALQFVPYLSLSAPAHPRPSGDPKPVIAYYKKYHRSYPPDVRTFVTRREHKRNRPPTCIYGFDGQSYSYSFILDSRADGSRTVRFFIMRAARSLVLIVRPGAPCFLEAGTATGGHTMCLTLLLMNCRETDELLRSYQAGKRAGTRARSPEV
jgi:hypothetical protein